MQKPVRIAPSVLAADFSKLGAEIEAVTKAGADAIHLDVMDGHFVPNISYGPAVIAAMRAYTKLPFDCHLMIAPVDASIRAYVDAGADCITVHCEAGPHLHRSVQLIKSLGVRAGVALNPGTPLEAVEQMLGDIDLALVMSVNPGFGGQNFIESQLGKIAMLRAWIDESGFDVDLEVDGGVNPQTARMCVAAGADVLVAGSAVFQGGPGAYAENIAALRP